MPYKRVGKCVYKKYDNGELGAKVGCSDSVEKAKDYLKALYASEGGDIKEEKDMSTQDYVNLYMKNKQQFVNRYGKDAENVIKKRAEKLVKSKEEKSLKELVNKLVKEKLDPVGKEDDDINNDGKVDKTDKYLANRRKAISKNINEGFYVTRNKGRNQGKELVKSEESDFTQPQVFPTLEKAQEYVDYITSFSSGMPGQIFAYYVSDANMNRVNIDGKVDKTDDYLKNLREKISKSIKKEHHLKENPDAKYVATSAPGGWFDVWEGEPFDITGEKGILVGKFKTMKDAKTYADIKNGEQGKLEEPRNYLLEGIEGVSSKDELRTKIRLLANDIVSKKKEKVAKEETFPILYKFPSLKVILNDLFASQLEPFIEKINWVAPNPTTFRIDLKNGEYFFLTYTGKVDDKDLYVAQIAGKKYYLESLMDQERATDALARILMQGNFEEVPEDEEAPTEEEVEVETEETTEETPAEEETPEEEA